MSKTKHNRTYGFLVGAALLLVMWFVASMLFTFASCNTPKRSAQLFDKANRKSPVTVAGKCGAMFPPVDSIHESYIYKEGKPVVKVETKYVTVNCDSLIKAAAENKTANNTPNGGNTFKVPCPPCDSFRVDTAEFRKHVELSNNATEQELRMKNVSLTADNVKMTERRNMWRIIALIALSYTLLRLILKRWIKLP